MRKTTATISQAFLSRTAKKMGNTQTDGTALYLFGNKIAEFRKDGLYISNAGWQSVTTKERLNGLDGVSISQSKGVWYLNGKQWDGGWIKISSLVPLLKNAKPVFDMSLEYKKQDGWRGFSQPVHAVAGANNTGMFSDSPCPSDVCEKEINRIAKFLAGQGMPTKQIVCETSNVFCVHVYLVAYPHQAVQARDIVKQFLKDNKTRLLYVA